MEEGQGLEWEGACSSEKVVEQPDQSEGGEGEGLEEDGREASATQKKSILHES